ncbi:DUF2334 domain-containing protein [Ruminococcus sp. Marseille-P328]|uniref:DUF2334 domain-containing protein n=1 Tax=Ruminococcus sp. Marseille-P328 TaxID=1816688 RepID=UPI003562F2D8
MSRKILIRFDDICPTMDLKQWNRAVAIIDKYDIKPLIGVIPCCEDEDLFIDKENNNFWNDINELQAKGYVIAMHGLNHVCDNNFHGMINKTIGSEFAGYPYEVQYDKIKKGKQIMELHGVYTDIFFAPRHSYDINTLRALKDNGFKYISDGKSNKPLIKQGIKCIPCRSAGCPKIKRNGCCTAVFHAHEWTREDKKKGYYDLVELCSKYHDDIVDFYEFANRKNGNYCLQILDERLYLIWEYRIRPILSYVKHRILKK